MEYSGNAIYDYVYRNDLDYIFSAEHEWLLVYGNSSSIPKVLAYICKVGNIRETQSQNEKKAANRAYRFSKMLGLPFICIRFRENDSSVAIWEGLYGPWSYITYDQLRGRFEAYGIVEPGTARKDVNQYLSSTYHDWQRSSLGKITVSDFDLIKINDKNKILEIVELKRSKLSLNDWKPYRNDFANFALIINTIVLSGKNIPFYLYYNVMKDGEVGKREEDTSSIMVFEFIIPEDFISADEVRYRKIGQKTLQDLLL